MDWTNTAHVAQAIFWSVQVALFAVGYRIGDRTI